jgi:hypothetical protein
LSKRNRRGTVRVLVVNTHAGISLRYGLIAWVFAHFRLVSVIIAQEVRSGRSLRRSLGKGWICVPHEQPGERNGAGGNEAGTYICFRKRRYRLLGMTNEPIRFGERYMRRATGAIVRDKRTGQDLRIADVHPAPLGGGLVNGSPGQRRRQTMQLRAYAKWLSEGDEIRLAGGDFNQPLAAQVPSHVVTHSAHHIFGKVGLRAASSHRKSRGPVRLMDLFIPKNDDRVNLRSRRSFYVPVRGLDHEVVFVRLRVKPRR